MTITCARWLPLFSITGAYQIVYKWFDVLRSKGHHIVAYVIMPSHIHLLVAFSTTDISINKIAGNGKRFMAYELVKQLRLKNRYDLLKQMGDWVNHTDRKRNKLHEVFEPSFDCKHCYSMRFLKQKTDYIHMNPCKQGLALLPEAYIHSSARYYYSGEQGVYPVITYMELQDIDLSKSV
jgi:REP element-mobilizing transposase RayT